MYFLKYRIRWNGMAYPLERYGVSAGTVWRIRWNGMAYPLERYGVSAGYGIKGTCHLSWLNAAVVTCYLFSQRVQDRCESRS